jgi:ABC-2 type transport system permease protein
MNYFSDTLTLTKRCLRLTFRNLDGILIAVVLPVMMLLAFVFLFGSGMEMGREAYTNFVVPGILIIAAGYCASITAQNIHVDVAKGVVDRFRSMPIANSSFLIGHVMASLVRSSISMVIVIIAALLSGFRPTAGAVNWLIIAGLLLLFLLVITWISVFLGLIAKTVESAGAFGFVILFLPYLSSGFVEPATLPAGLRVFAEHQPLTHIIDSMRNLSMGLTLGNEIWFTLIWFGSLLVLGYALSMIAYRRKAR